jgi:hypothetical protein
MVPGAIQFISNYPLLAFRDVTRKPVAWLHVDSSI